MSEISSPCVKNCCLDKDDVCIGCGRSVDEIIRWGDADDSEKHHILLASKQRKLTKEKKLRRSLDDSK